MAGRYFSRQVRPIYQASTLQEMMMPLQLQQERHDKTLAAIESQALDFQNLGADTEEADRIRSEFTKQKSSVTDKILNEGISKDSYRDFLKVKRMRDSELNPGGSAYKMQNEYASMLKHHDMLDKMIASGKFDMNQIEAARAASLSNYKGVLEGSSYQGITPGTMVNVGQRGLDIAKAAAQNPSGYLKESGWVEDPNDPGKWINQTEGWKGTTAEAISKAVETTLSNDNEALNYLNFNKKYLNGEEPSKIIKDIADNLGQSLKSGFTTFKTDMEFDTATRTAMRKGQENLNILSGMYSQGKAEMLTPKTFKEMEKNLDNAKKLIKDINTEMTTIQKNDPNFKLNGRYQQLLDQKKLQENLIAKQEERFNLLGVKDLINFVDMEDYQEALIQKFSNIDGWYEEGSKPEMKKINEKMRKAIDLMSNMSIEDAMVNSFGNRPVIDSGLMGDLKDPDSREKVRKQKFEADKWDAFKDVLEDAYNSRKKALENAVKEKQSLAIYKSPTLIYDDEKDGSKSIITEVTNEVNKALETSELTSFSRDGMQIDIWEKDNDLDGNTYSLNGRDYTISGKEAVLTDQVDPRTGYPIVQITYYGERKNDDGTTVDGVRLKQENFSFHITDNSKFLRLATSMSYDGEGDMSYDITSGGRSTGERLRNNLLYGTAYDPVKVLNMVDGDHEETLINIPGKGPLSIDIRTAGMDDNGNKLFQIYTKQNDGSYGLYNLTNESGTMFDKFTEADLKQQFFNISQYEYNKEN